MNKKIAYTFLFLTANSLLATNGTNLVGIGPISNSVGGVGIAMSNGVESGLLNPALISSIKGSKFSFAGTIFMPTVSYSGNPMNNEFAESSATLSLIPEVAFVHKVNSKISWGVGMWGVSGMGVKYSSETQNQGTMEMGSSLQIMQFGIPISYSLDNNLKLGFTPIVQYGTMDLNYNVQNQNIGTITAQDINFGFIVGMAYKINSLNFGLVYKSAIDMEYEDVLTTAVKPFERAGVSGISDHFETPSEYGVGFSYNFLGNQEIAFDYKMINWADSKGFKDFNWENQLVYAVGYKLNLEKWILRSGFNYGENPITEQDISTVGAGAINMFNLLATPAIVETHYTFGTTYLYNKNINLNFAYQYVPESEAIFKTAQQMPDGTISMFDITNRHSQQNITIGVSYQY